MKHLVNTFLLLAGFVISVAATAQGPFIKGKAPQGPHPVISEILGAINKDSLTAHMQWMVNMGTRYLYAENRREVASLIADKLRSYGYVDVALDSFKIKGESVPEDSIWQYNVIADAAGASAPGEIYIIGAHHDCMVNEPPNTPAPGADDDASGCAVVLEIARVLKEKGFQPESTIRFITFAAEELTYNYVGTSGSIYYAEKIFAQGEDLRLIINNDMLGWTPDTLNSLTGSVVQNTTSRWAGRLLLASAGTYADLNIYEGNYPTADAEHFNDLGYPVTGFMEYGLNPYYHTIDDSVNACNIDLCLEAARSSCAILLNEQMTPVPRSVYCTTGKSAVTVVWQHSGNTQIQGYNIYRSTLPDSAFALIGQAQQGDTAYQDATAEPGILYYYVTSLDGLQFESLYDNIAQGSLAPKDRDLLIVKDSKGGYNNPPDSLVNTAYQQIFRDLTYDYSDASVSDSLNLSVLSHYQKILWLSNTYSNDPNSSMRRHYDEIVTYIRSGGQLFIAGFQPTFMITGNTAQNKTFLPSDTIYRWFKIQQIQRKPTSAMNGAYPCADEYDSLWIDPEKAPSTPAGHVYNIDCIFPAAEATLIYRFNSAFDTNTSLGKMKRKPVGIEYLGDDFRVIILSAPLYYLDSLDAKTLAELVVNKKFISHVGCPEINTAGSSLSIDSHPNPCRDFAVVTYTTGRKCEISLELVSLTGTRIMLRNEGTKVAGTYTATLPVGTLPAGTYLLVIQGCNESASEKLVIVK